MIQHRHTFFHPLHHTILHTHIASTAVHPNSLRKRGQHRFSVGLWRQLALLATTPQSSSAPQRQAAISSARSNLACLPNMPPEAKVLLHPGQRSRPCTPHLMLPSGFLHPTSDILPSQLCCGEICHRCCATAAAAAFAPNSPGMQAPGGNARPSHG